MTDAIKPDDEATVGNVSAVPAATSAESLPESTNNPTTEDTKIPTTDTPLDSSSSQSALSQLASQLGGSADASSGEPIGATAASQGIDVGTAGNVSADTSAAGNAASAADTSDASIAAEDPNAVVLPAASSPASDTASSASNVLPVEGTADTAADSSLLAAGKADAAVIPAPVVASTSGGVVGGMLPVAPLPVVEQGNVQAAGALDADGTGSQKDDEDRHPAVPHLRALRNKIESGEAIIMADLLALLHRIEESL